MPNFFRPQVDILFVIDVFQSTIWSHIRQQREMYEEQKLEKKENKHIWVNSSDGQKCFWFSANKFSARSLQKPFPLKVHWVTSTKTSVLSKCWQVGAQNIFVSQIKKTRCGTLLPSLPKAKELHKVNQVDSFFKISFNKVSERQCEDNTSNENHLVCCHGDILSIPQDSLTSLVQCSDGTGCHSRINLCCPLHWLRGVKHAKLCFQLKELVIAQFSQGRMPCLVDVFLTKTNLDFKTRELETCHFESNCALKFQTICFFVWRYQWETSHFQSNILKNQRKKQSKLSSGTNMCMSHVQHSSPADCTQNWAGGLTWQVSSHHDSVASFILGVGG